MAQSVWCFFLFSVPLVADALILKHKRLHCTLRLSSPVAEEGLVGDASWESVGMGKGRVSLAVTGKRYSY